MDDKMFNVTFVFDRSVLIVQVHMEDDADPIVAARKLVQFDHGFDPSDANDVEVERADA